MRPQCRSRRRLPCVQPVIGEPDAPTHTGHWPAAPAGVDRPAGDRRFHLGLLACVAEVGVIAAGLVVLNGPLHAPQAAVAWIALVVGVHFLAFAVIWKLLFFHGLGAALMICGVAGFVLAAIGAAVSAIDLVGGVLPGAILR